MLDSTKYPHVGHSLIVAKNYNSVLKHHTVKGTKETTTKMARALPSCLHIPHFLLLGGCEDVGPGLLVPLCPGNICPNNECNRPMVMD
jgi:hypothetical protein